MAAILTFQNVSFGYIDSADIIDGVTFSVEPNGERVFLVGPSGTGKSTILRLALGLLQPTAGAVESQAVKPIPLMQNFATSLLPWFTVRTNLCFGAGESGSSLFEKIAVLFEIESLLDARPGELSGGQIQRVLFARALCQKPDFLIVDEPLSNLDIPLSNRILARLKEYLSEEKVSIFWITHRHFEAGVLANKIFHLENRKLQAIQPQELAAHRSFIS